MTPTRELQKPIIKTNLPGPKAQEIIAADAQYVTPSYPRPDYEHAGAGRDSSRLSNYSYIFSGFA